MPSPSRPRFVADKQVADYAVPVEDAGPSAEYTLAPPDPAILPPVRIRREAVPNPRVSTFSVHPTLAVLPMDAFIAHASTIADAGQPATNPETETVFVLGYGLPWPLRISSTGDSSCVTVCDVVESLRAFLSGAASASDFANAPDPEAVTRAFHARTHGNRELHDAGTLRVDYLPGPIIGLDASASKDDATLELVFHTSSQGLH